MLKKLEDFDWYCNSCSLEITGLKDQVQELKTEKVALAEENKLLCEKLAILESQIENIKSEVKEEVSRQVSGQMDIFLDKMK